MPKRRINLLSGYRPGRGPEEGAEDGMPSTHSPNRGGNRLALARPIGTALATAWASLARHDPSPRKLLGNRVVAVDRHDPSTAAIDQLRTRILNMMEQRGWRHLGITSPTWGCGVTFTAANLGVSFGRQTHIRTILVDANLRDPGLATVFAARDMDPLLPALQEEATLESCTRRLFENLAVVFNGAPVDNPAEVLRSSVTDRVLSRSFEALEIDVALYDLPPVLAHDDVLALSRRLDAILLVVRGGRSTTAEVRELEGLVEGEVPILATVLNEAVDGAAAPRGRH